MTKFDGLRKPLAAFLLCAAVTIGARAQTFNSLAEFDGTNGIGPYLMSLVQGTDGRLYGTTQWGGASANGTVFRVTTDGTLTTLYSFCTQTNCADGFWPYAGLVQGTDGNYYGTTYYGGTSTSSCSSGCGTVFKITPLGTLTTLHSFNSVDGANPMGALVLASDGNLYGTTEGGGTYSDGTVFRINAKGTLTVLYSFCSLDHCADGGLPSAGLIEASDGKLYGTTQWGGPSGVGTAFKITRTGTLSTIYGFCGCADGANPMGALVLASDGNFYGTTYSGGANVYYGTVFKMTPAGGVTTLHSFDTSADFPQAGLLQATDGNFYGTTRNGGDLSCNPTAGCGTLFQITYGGNFTILHSFESADGTYPLGGLIQDTSGVLYGSTQYGGSFASCGVGCGSIFSLSMGLGQFVKTLPAFAKAGVEVGILGTNLAGATSVTFNGTLAQFSVRSPSWILTHVPAGATTGKVQVTLPGQTLSTSVPFYVLK